MPSQKKLSMINTSPLSPLNNDQIAQQLRDQVGVLALLQNIDAVAQIKAYNNGAVTIDRYVTCSIEVTSMALRCVFKCATEGTSEQH
jgi:hypothetical protein